MIDLSKYFTHALQRNQRSSALSPLLWLNTLVTIPSLAMCLQAQGGLRVALFTLASVIVIATIVAYGYLVRKDPRLVQSESYQLEARKLDIIATKGGPVLEAITVEASEEPKRIAPASPVKLPPGTKHEE